MDRQHREVDRLELCNTWMTEYLWHNGNEVSSEAQPSKEYSLNILPIYISLNFVIRKYRGFYHAFMRTFSTNILLSWQRKPTKWAATCKKDCYTSMRTAKVKTNLRKCFHGVIQIRTLNWIYGRNPYFILYIYLHYYSMKEVYIFRGQTIN